MLGLRRYLKLNAIFVHSDLLMHNLYLLNLFWSPLTWIDSVTLNNVSQQTAYILISEENFSQRPCPENRVQMRETKRV